MRNRKIVLFVCGAQRSYVRNEIILTSLRKNFNVIEITSNMNSYLLRLPSVLLRFIFNRKRYDLLFVGFLGQPLMPFMRLLTKKQIIFDAFISVYDTLCFDRKKIKPNSIIGKMSYWLDKKSCQWADKIITDTKAHADYFSKTFNINRKKLHHLYVGADEKIFYPRSSERDKKYKNKSLVFYYGSGIPSQGIDIILKAAKLLENESDIIFQLAGPIRRRYKKLIEKLNLKNIEFLGWVSYKYFPDKITQADICLGGHFSSIDKARRVISGKTFQFVAMKKPTIVGESIAIKELFEDKKHVLMCKMGDSKSLTQAILLLKKDKNLREKIAERGYQLYLNRCTPKAIANILSDLLNEFWENKEIKRHYN